MKQTAKIFFVLYTIAVLLDLLFIFLQRDDLRWFSKPLLMPLLLLAFLSGTGRKSGRQTCLIIAALVLSGCGDVLLQAKGLFIPGLVSFLLAHGCYILYFSKAGNKSKGFLQRHPLLILPVLLYIVLLLVLLFPYLGQLKIPVVIYSLTIGAMLLMAINSKYRVTNTAATHFIAGALLFVISDSLLAVNLFAIKQGMLGPGVMATYAAAQFLIVKGTLQSAESVKNNER